MIYILKTHPFYMSMEEIKNLTMFQCDILIKEYAKNRKEKNDAIRKRVSGVKKKALQYVYDVGQLIE